MILHLHFGAHKTASTHLQATLRKNRATLAAAGVEVAPPDVIRRLTARGRRVAGRTGLNISATLAGLRLARLAAGDRDRLIATDENSLGSCEDIIATGALYPDAAPRAGLWRRLAARGDAAVYLGLREYGALFSAIHAQTIRNGTATALEGRPRGRLAALRRRWPHVVDDLRAALPGVRIVLWAHEDYDWLRPVLIERLTGLRDLSPVRRRPMATPSGAAMRAMIAAATLMPDRRLDARAFDAISAAYPISGASPRYAPFTDQQTAAMRAAYEDDLALLRSDPALEFLAP